MRSSKPLDSAAIKSVAALSCQLNPVELVTPSNFSAVRSDFRDFLATSHFLESADQVFDDRFNPSFVYDEDKLTGAQKRATTVVELLDDILDSLIPEGYADKFVVKVLRDRCEEFRSLNLALQAMLCHNDSDSCHHFTNIYGLPPVGTLYSSRIFNHFTEHAPLFLKDDATRRAELQSKQFDAQDIGWLFAKVLRLIGITGWNVEVSPRFTSIDVRDADSSGGSVIGIPESREVNGLKLLELVGHEINSHLRGSENTRSLFRQLLGNWSPLLPLVPLLAKSMNETVYEGVAKHSDVYVRGSAGFPSFIPSYIIDSVRHREYLLSFAHVLNVVYAEKLNEADLAFRKLSPERLNSLANSAWMTTYRLFRGSTQRGGTGYVFPKDHSYFTGYLAVEHLPLATDFSTLTESEVHALNTAAGITSVIRFQDYREVLLNRCAECLLSL